MQEQLEFPWVHLIQYGGMGYGLPGPIGHWCDANNLSPLFSKPYIEHGLIDKCSVRVGVYTITEAAKRTMIRDFPDYGACDFVHRPEIILNRGISFIYSGLQWKLIFLTSDHIRWVGSRFDIILADLSIPLNLSLKEYLKY